MQILDITNQILDAMEKGQVSSSAYMYADNLKFTGPVPMPLGKSEYLDLMEKVVSAVPNFNFHRHDLKVEGQTVVVPVRLTGTQTKTLRPLMPGMPELPPTNRTFQLPPETIQIRFQGDQVAEIHIDPVPGGGIPGMLEQLGVSIPVTGPDEETHK